MYRQEDFFFQEALAIRPDLQNLYFVIRKGSIKDNVQKIP